MLLPFQLLIVSPFLAPVWIAGLLSLLRSARAQRVRALGLAYLALLAIALVTGAKVYYVVGFYPLLLAADGGGARFLARARRPGSSPHSP